MNKATPVRNINFYSTKAHYEDQISLGRTPRLKIGDTEEHDVMVRINDQDTTSDPEPLELKAAMHDVPFRDKAFHRYLVRKGYDYCRWDKKREWLYITTEDAKRELEQFANKQTYTKLFTPRTPQQMVVDDILPRWKGETIVQPLDLCPRFG